MKALFKPFLIMAFILSASSFFGQDFKTEVKMIDPSNQHIDAGLFFTQISKSKLDELVMKMKSLNLYTVTDEFFSDKNTARVQLKSNNIAAISDLESFLKQASIYSVTYKNQVISSQELSANYTAPNKNEIKKTDRIK